MKLIGLTGGAGSGKSSVAAIFRDLGAVVIDADQAAHAAYAPGQAGFDAIVKEFGADYVRGGQIDRARLGDLVFRDEDARRKLNAIVHPLVRSRMAEETVAAEERGAPVVIHDVPLLFENGLQDLYADVVLVYAPERVQVERLVAGRGLSEERARSIIAAQLPIDLKRERAQHVIDNSGSRESTREQVTKLWKEISSAG